MEIYAAQGHTDFVLAAGFKAELVETFAATLPDDWSVRVVDTGEETNTGGRVQRCAPLMGDTYFVTYADGVGDVDLEALVAFHRGHDGAATLTTVPLTSQYGTVEADNRGRVTHFLEKPRLAGHYINAGFFVFDERAERFFCGDDLERHFLPDLAAAGELSAYRHHGFWRSMDTYKDALELTALCGDGRPPWAPGAGVAAPASAPTAVAPTAVAPAAVAPAAGAPAAAGVGR
jgi:glucose-1-phosphate cytidylyltransferase